MTDNISRSKKWSIFLVIVTSTFMTTLDSSIVNVALPVMSQKLGVTTSDIQFVATIYLIVISAIILLFGKLGDMLGKTKVFTFGVIVFTAGSLLCGLSQSFEFLIFSRIVQAIGASAAMGINQGIITEVFPKSERGKALGLLGTVVALGSLVGPGLGGIIVGSIGWEYIFYINLPIGIADAILCFIILPKEKAQKKEKVDIVGTLLFITSIVPLFIALNESVKYGFDNIYIILMLAVAAVSFVAFILVERKIKNPLLDLSIFSDKLFSLSIFCGFIGFVAIFCNNIIMPFYLQNARGFSPQLAGLILMAYPLMMAFIAPLSGHLSDKIGSELLTFIGLSVVSAGMIMLSFLNLSSPIAVTVILIALTATGMALFQPPNNSLIMSTVKKSELGIAGSINALVRNIGMICGISLATSLLYSVMSANLGRRVTDFVEGRADVFINGMRAVYLVAAAVIMLGAVLTLIRLINARIKNKNKAA